MVAFGAKLLDNKVSEWSEHYIDYEKLKDVLSKMSASHDKLQELRERKPELVDAIIEHRSLVVSPSPSQLNLDATSHEDQTVSTGNTTYGSMDATSEGTSETSSLLRVISRAASGVSDLFYKNYEKSVRETLRAIDAAEEEFDRLLQLNLTRVNTFYEEKLDELTERVTYLKESAAQLHKNSPAAEGHDTPDNAESPLIESNGSGVRNVLARLKFPRPRRHSSSDDPDSQSNLLEILNDDNEAKSISKGNVREAESIQRAMEDHYRSAKLLHNYVVMNYTGFVKIIKKFDKTLKQKKGKYKTAIKKENICGDGQAIVALSSRMEVLYANWFCDRNINAARAQMLTKRGDGLEMDWSQLQLGYRMGMCSILGLWVCWDCIWGLLSEGMSTIGGRTAFPVFRACAGLVMLEWCWGFSVWVWNRYRVNYIFLFDFDPSTVEGPLVLFNHAVNNTLVYLICTLLYYKSGAHDIPGNLPPGVFPVFLVLYGTVQLVFPWRRRGPMWSAIWSVISAPSSSPSFFHGYVGDIFTSLVKVFQDLAWTVCFVVSGDWMISEDLKASGKHRWSGAEWYSGFLIPILTLLPLVFRFNQCLRRYADTRKRYPHIANACKYAMSQTVTLFGAFHPLYMSNRKDSDIFQAFWTFAFVASSLYSFWWDVFQDFGLGQFQHGFLAPRLMYPSRSFYYVIIAIDLVLRFAWVLTLLPPKSGAKFALPAYLSLVSMLFEIFRRTLWGFLRLENEHRTNTAGYRRVGFVPLHFSTGHNHSYAKQGEARRGSTVLIEITIITLAVAAAGIVSVVAAQHATQNMDQKEL